MRTPVSRHKLTRILSDNYPGNFEGQEWEAMYYHCKDLHQAVKSKKPGEHKKKTNVLWAVKQAKD